MVRLWNYKSNDLPQNDLPMHDMKFGKDKQFYVALYWTCAYLSMLGFKLIHFSKRGPLWCVDPYGVYSYNRTETTIHYMSWNMHRLWWACFCFSYSVGTDRCMRDMLLVYKHNYTAWPWSHWICIRNYWYVCVFHHCKTLVWRCAPFWKAIICRI